MNLAAAAKGHAKEANGMIKGLIIEEIKQP
jgi:hypothetical protein